MSANISSMAYFGEKPWHGLGTRLESAATSAEAIVAAGLDWEVEKLPLFLKDGRDSGTFATIRKDNGAILGAGLRDQFTVVQNKDKFRIIDAIVGASEAVFHTAGALGEGERVWLLAKLPGYIEVAKDDLVEKFLLLADGHDGSLSLQVRMTSVRVVCQNTLGQALSEETKFKSKVRHTKNIAINIESVREALGIVKRDFDFLGESFKKLAHVQVTKQQVAQFAREVIAPEAKKPEDISSKAQNIIEEVSRLFERGVGQDLPGVRGTAWAALNGVTEYVDYRMGSKETSGKTKETNRVNSILFGTGAAIKARALSKALQLA